MTLSKMAVSLTGMTLLLCAALLLPGQTKEETARKATALLTAKCMPCHASGAKAGGVDLSDREHALQTQAFVAGDPAQSRLMAMTRAGKMPPSGRLTEAEIALLERWVAEGGSYPAKLVSAPDPAMRPLWSFQPVRRYAVPKTPFDSLSANPIDRFVFQKLAAAGLKPSPPASRLALLRRVSIDLTGLPPTPEEVAAFLNDRSPNAYEKVVDRLLASPAYGERWGRHWLDVVRYGESHGYEQNHLRPNAWHYRDYVIRAFNADMPYPQFILEQLAGDVVSGGNPHVEAATGFLVAGIHDTVGIQTEEGTRQQRANDIEDMVSTTSAAFLGLTVGCARCHDHKFDPIPQRDFYRLAAVFAGVRHGERPLKPLTEAERRESEEIERQLVSHSNAIREIDSQAREAVLRSRGKSSETRPAVNARHNVDAFPPVTARFVRFTVLATNDGAEPCLDEIQLFGPGGEENLALASSGARAEASSLLPGFAIHQISHLNDGRLGNDFSWISGTRGAGWAQIELPTPKTINRVIWSRDSGEIPRFDDRLPVSYRIEVSLDAREWRVVSSDQGRSGSVDYIHPDALRAAMTPEQRHLRDRLNAEKEKLEQRRNALRNRQMAYIGQFVAPEETYILRRGDVMQRGEKVLPGALSQIKTLNADLSASASKPEPERRLALARWIGSPHNPLTARVIVNRVWQYHFGRGIVGTPSDFGRNGERPTHPQLLDWLASDFMANGWRLKRLHRQIVTSYTYRQSSAANAAGMAKDAGNRLLWRMPLRRMEAEALRDAILQTSGKLDRTMGGPGYRLFKYRVVNVAIYEPLEEFGPETWRRGIYQQSARAIRDDLLSAFDCPESSQRAPRRESTTTALQALSLLNGSFIQQQAGFFAERVRREVGEDPARQVERAFRLAFGRSPRPVERQPALSLLRSDGLTVLCRALLNANEFLYY